MNALSLQNYRGYFVEGQRKKSYMYVPLSTEKLIHDVKNIKNLIVAFIIRKKLSNTKFKFAWIEV